MSEWNIQRARAGYNIAHWGEGCFDIDEQGRVCVLAGNGEPGVALQALCEQVREGGMQLPVLLRFPGILRRRVRTLLAAFDEAMARDGYGGGYTAIYPIKVNQQQSVVQAILSADEGGGRVGLEAGSKPELMAVLAQVPAGGTIVCNGYKDREYIRLALIGRRLGLKVYLVVEKPGELELILEEAEALGVEPLLGLRLRLASIAGGKWQNSGGEKAKFGLSAGQILDAVERLRAAGRLDSLRLLHVHMGSQIANIRDIQSGAREMARHYLELSRLGAPLEVVDVGGGLGVDYEGTRSRSDCSMNYSLAEYAHHIVHTLAEACRAEGLTEPRLFSESGRALTAHHAVLVTDVIDIEQAPEGEPEPPVDTDPAIIHDLWRGYRGLGDGGRSVLEVYHEAVHALGEAQAMYTHGVLSLEQRAAAEALYFATCHRVQGLLQPSVRAHRELLDELGEKLADKVFCNMSLFQSLPDVWGIDQVFPVMPLSGHLREPQRHAVLQDLTCDSDGRIDRYVNREGVESTLPLHDMRGEQDYLLGFFLVGAYQEILGDMHNLFGDTDSVDVELEGDVARLENPRRGNSVDELLRYVHYDPSALMTLYREKVAAADLPEPLAETFIDTLAAGLEGYTYLEP